MSLTSTPDVTAIPAGFVLVPIEPTPEMIAAYLNANTEYWHATDALPKPANKWRTGTPPEATAAGYRAMLSAAPVAPIEAAASSHEQEIAIRESLEANAILIWGPHFAYSSTDERVFSQGFRSGWGAREHPKTVTSLAFPVAVPAITVAPAVPEGDKLDARSDDTKRLDYLQDRGSSIDLLPGDRGFYPMRFRIGGLSASVNVDVRIAIDAAMQATGATP